jgi:TPP-dependent 2-oxoacid decarboxylase
MHVAASLRACVAAQAALTPDVCVLAETGDSWFNCMKLRLPDGAGFEIQMRYGRCVCVCAGHTVGCCVWRAASDTVLLLLTGVWPRCALHRSIGWSVGATLGYSLAAAADGKRLMSFIGDGSFQVGVCACVCGGSKGTHGRTHDP